MLDAAAKGISVADREPAGLINRTRGMCGSTLHGSRTPRTRAPGATHPGAVCEALRKSNKNDFIDAEAIAEAVTKQNIRFVQIKTQEQLDWQAMHGVRDRLVQRRTALINEIRGFLLERGLTFAARPIYLRKNLPTVIEDAEQNLSPHLRWLLDRLWQECKQTETEIEAITDEIERISNEDRRCRQLRQIPGFGPLVSTATVAAIGNGSAFRRGRDFASLDWSGAAAVLHRGSKLYGISKRGNIYLRRMLIHGARAARFASSTTPEDSGSGCTDWPNVLRATKSW